MLYSQMPINKCTMATRVILTYKKQEGSGDFISMPDDVIQLLNQYKTDGKLIDWSKNEDDADSTVYTMTWQSDEDKEEFRKESKVLEFADLANKHNFDNSITSTLDEFFV